ncbi:glycoside hydrolase family 2 TIM barrel-domain containing protein, partial [Clostridium sp. D33t1_170424_F3]|uniref:glycoside hydrolase family 2 TIM barrel-domain containing protein n=1 Tax=Clostridium sp. D33t1_170424_F3 TaxID=2787099 RepID=UPI0018AC837F
MKRKMIAALLSFVLVTTSVSGLAAAENSFGAGEAVSPAKMHVQEDYTYTQNFENVDSTEQRLRTNIDFNWKFYMGDAAGAADPAFDDSAWRLLNLPHDWSIEGEYSESNPMGPECGYLPAGIGWYRKTLEIPPEWRDGRQLSIEFDGVYRNSEVYVDGIKLGERPYGWVSFAYDLTEQIRDKESVEIAVRVDNSLQPAARWYTGSGIYGHVWLLSTAPVHISRYGTYVTTPKIAETEADVQIENTIINESESTADVAVKTVVYEKDGDTPVASQESRSQMVEPGKEAVVVNTVKVADPLLWDTENPNLYYVKTEILQDGAVVDDSITTFGIRSIEVRSDTGFWLNGKNVKLKGVADHRVVGALGAAPSKNIVKYRIQMLKDMGVNAIRTSHNPQTPEFYELCDEMGMMVMDEIFDGWSKKAEHDYGRYHFAQWWRTDVREWVMRDRNAPSVIMWSIGNETGSKDSNGISALIKTMDTTRPTTGGGVTTGVDVVGINGPSEVVGYQQPNTQKPFVATEAPHTMSVRGMYETQTWYRDGYSNKVFAMDNLTDKEIFQYDWIANPAHKRGFQSSYDNAYVRDSARTNWTLTRDQDWRMGEFRWSGFDYIGEAGYVSGGWPYRIFSGGAADSAMFPKDLYYLYQSMWTEEPMVHILPSWTHPVMEKDTEIPVWVYSNCDEVELIVNGQSMGRKNKQSNWENIQFDWLVPWKEGTVTAVGYNNGEEVSRETLRTAGVPAKISLKSTTDGNLPVDPTFIEQITVSTTDEQGNFYPYGENRAYYYVDGPSYIRAVDNGSPVDVERHTQNNRNAFMGLNKVYLQPTQDTGDILFIAGSILGEKRQIISDHVSIDVEQLALRGNPARKDIAVYYTTDGTEPDLSAQKYEGTFSVELGTTVKAAVYADGKRILLMEETFAEDQGLYWKTESAVEPDIEGSYAAGDAVLTGPSIKLNTAGSGFHDSYVDFANNAGTIEWDSVEAAQAGDYYLSIRYNNGAPLTKTKKLQIIVNGTVQGTQNFPKNGEWMVNWSNVTIPIQLEKGTNTIQLVGKAGEGANIDEIVVLPADQWRLPQEATLGGSASIKDDGSAAIGSQYVDMGNNKGNAAWTVRAPKSGSYPCYLFYSSNKPETPQKNIEIYVNGVLANTFPIVTTGSWNGIWQLAVVPVKLQAGDNTVKIMTPSGGACINALRIYPCKESAATEWKVINSSCVSGSRLGVLKGVPAGVSTDIVEDTAVWGLEEAPNGAYYLKQRESGTYLAYVDGALQLLDNDVDGNAQWKVNGDRELFDYIQHVNTNQKLAIMENGELGVFDASYGVDDDFFTNRAYWAIHNMVDDTVKAPKEVAEGISGIENPEAGATALHLPMVDDGFSVRILSSSDTGIVALDGSIHAPLQNTMVTLVLQVRRAADGSTARTAEFEVMIPGRDDLKESALVVQYGNKATLEVTGKTDVLIDGNGIYGAKVMAGEELTLTFTPVNGPFASAQLNGEDIPFEADGCTYTFTMPNDKTVLRFTFTSVNKDVLETLLEKANEVTDEQLDKLVESVRTKFLAARDNAKSVYENDKATQDEVNEAWKELLDAMHYLSFEEGTKDELKYWLDYADNLNLDNFTPKSQEGYAEALAYAEEIYNDEGETLKAVVEKAAKDLYNAILRLTFKANTETLAAFVEQAQEIATRIDQYMDGAEKDAFEKILPQAEALLEDANAAQKQVDELAEALYKAIQNMRMIPDREALKDLIDTYEALNPADYTEASYAIL